MRTSLIALAAAATLATGIAQAEPANYGLLAELNTMPRTSYLASVRNPNAELLAALGKG